MNNVYVTASELADYIYCECCWADKLEGARQETEEMLQGTAAHNRLQWQYQAIEFVKSVALVVIVGCSILLVLFVVLYFLTRS
jgi:hypothetical protein